VSFIDGILEKQTDQVVAAEFVIGAGFGNCKKRRVANKVSVAFSPPAIVTGATRALCRKLVFHANWWQAVCLVLVL
jgi:hypothetical protein